jgi:hypothetical protein
MATSKSPATAHNDAIRIVPLQRPAIHAEALPAVAARLTYRNGPLLPAVEVFAIFWGSAWKKSPLSGTVAQINQFFDAILVSGLIDQLAEYNAGAFKIAHGRRTGSVTITTASPGRSLTDAAIRSFLQQQISSGKAPKVTKNSLYFIFVPPGVRVVMGGSASCQAFCGYHNAIGRKTFYAVMPYPDCSGCAGSFAAFDALTSTSSHELCEAITDPIPGEGWYDDANGEIGDICAWETKTVGQYTVQLEWSNKSNRCV